MEQCKYEELATGITKRRNSHRGRRVFYCLLVAVLCILILLLAVIWIAYQNATNQAKKLDGVERHLAENEEASRNDRLRMDSRLASIERRLTEDEDTIKNLYDYLRDLKRNLTLMHAEHAAKLQQEGTNNSLLRNKIEEIESSRELFQKHLKQVDAKIEQLDRRNNQPVHIFKKCESTTESCVLGSRGNGAYWKACRTNLLLLEETVSVR